MLLDQSVALALQGFGWLPDLRRRAGADTVATRVMGQRATALCGPEAVRFFYDEDHVRRRTAVPEPVRGTLFGKGAVHTLDGAAHRVRKAMFLALMTPDGTADLVRRTTAAWDDAVASWAGRGSVVLFDASAAVIARGVCAWAGVPLADADAPAVAADLVALVDGFGTAGPRHWRARRARGRLQDRFGALVRDVRSGAVAVPAGSAVDVVARHIDVDGVPLDTRVAAVELLNVLRPTTAVSWFVTFAAHALHRWPQNRERLRTGDAAFAEAFTHEVRRFYPFAPFVGGRAVRNLTHDGVHIPSGSLILLDLYGQNHDERLWPEPYRFDPTRFVGRPLGAFDLVPQGGGDPRTGHRCPGEGITVALLAALAVRLAGLEYTVPAQDLTVPLHRIPTRPASGFVLTGLRAPVRPVAGTGNQFAPGLHRRAGADPLGAIDT